MAYSDETKRKALQLYLDGTPKSQIAELDSMPTRRTITKWSRQGVALPEDTSCTTWAEYAEEVETTRLIQAADRDRKNRNEELDDFYEEAIRDLKQAIRVSLENMKAGNYKKSASDPKKLLTTLARLENQGEELEEFQRKFAKGVLYIVREVTDEPTFNVIVSKVQELRERQLDKVDPQGRTERKQIEVGGGVPDHRGGE